MGIEAKRAEIECQLCNKTVEVNYRHQRMKNCPKCSRKLSRVAVRVQKQVDAQKSEARAKVAEKASVKPKKFKCPDCALIFECPKCSKAVKATPKKGSKPAKKSRKSVVKKGGKNAK